MSFLRRSSRRAMYPSAVRPATFESIERRLLMAAAINSAIRDAIGRVSDRSQYTKVDLDTTRQWAVRSTPNADVAELAKNLGATLVVPSSIIDGVYLATFARTKLDRLGGAYIAHAIDAVVGRGASWPLVERQQTPRSIPNDPRFANQWHLRNTGQGGGTVGADANIVDVWDQYQGDGVVIGVVDDGVTPTHEDLAPNYVPSLSYDFNHNDPVPSDGSHGTSVAGVAAGRGNNGLGGSGAAPHASIAGLELINGTTTDALEANALSYLRNDIDIYSNSWGPSDSGTVLQAPGPLTLAAFQSSVLSGRDGRGSIYTWAGGNGYDADNVNFDGYANSRFTIGVAAITNTAARSSYSERGASLIVGGYSSGGSLGIDTTAGSSNSAYTTSFGGTSSATPLVSGVIALMLQANPSLGWRDVQQILAKSAEKVSPTDAGWSNNGAGLHINDKFGYGGIDALAAVNLAKVWGLLAPEVTASTGTLAVNTAVPNLNATGISRSVTFNSPIKVESVEVVFNASHLSRGELQVFLTSPNGTESVLATQRTDTGDNFVNWTFTSKRMIDEDARGTWTLRVVDNTGSTVGTWNDWKLNVYGTALNATPSVSGTLYSDLNGNATRDAGEDGVNNITVWADLDNDGTLDSGEPSAVTTSTGSYSISDLTYTSYTIRASAPAGQFVTEGASGRTATLTSTAAYAGGLNFGVVTPSATGVIFDDLDANGARALSEPTLANVTVFGDLDNDSVLDAGEPSAVSGSDGTYRVVSLPVGTATTFRIVTPVGRRLTGVNAPNFNFTPAPGAYVAAGRDVGATTTVRISGRSFDDRNGNGVYTPGTDVGLGGVRIFLDANNDGVFNNTNYDYAQNTALPLSDLATSTSTLVVNGASGLVNNLSVRVAMTHTFLGDLVITLISPTGTRVVLANRNGSSSDNLNVTFTASGATTPASWPTGASLISGTYAPIGSFAPLDGQALNGSWKLEVVDAASGDSGTLTSWSIYGGSTEQNTLTASDGTYAFDALPAGTYAVRQSAPPAPYALASPAAGLQTVVAASGTVASSRDFANVNTTAPTFVSGAFLVDAPKPAVTLTFGSNVIVEPGDLTLMNQTTSATIPSSTFNITFDAATSIATVTFPGLFNGVLPDGNYRLTVTTGVTNAGGTPLLAAANVDFFVLAGDANRDRAVKFDDLLILAQNYGSTGRTFSGGNFDYSSNGLVNFDDLLLLAQQYGKAVALLTVDTTSKPAVKNRAGIFVELLI